MVWDALFEVNLDLVYTIESQALVLEQPLTMSLLVLAGIVLRRQAGDRA